MFTLLLEMFFWGVCEHHGCINLVPDGGFPDLKFVVLKEQLREMHPEWRNPYREML